MTTDIEDVTATSHDFVYDKIEAGEARAAVFRRTYDAPIEDVWDACTNPERLRRWYQPVAGDLRLGGEFTQGEFGPGTVVRCEAPRLLTISICDGVDEIELRLAEGVDDTTVLELQHSTTLDTHEIGGAVFDAVYCMGGGYGPRLITLGRHLAGVLGEDVDPTALHLRADMRPAIDSSMAALGTLLEAQGFAPVRS
jgi:uncharacterized protein YndB with AHSA1/START domain